MFYTLDPSKKGIAQLDDIVGAIPPWRPENPPWRPENPRGGPKTPRGGPKTPVPPEPPLAGAGGRERGFWDLGSGTGAPPLTANHSTNVQRRKFWSN